MKLSKYLHHVPDFAEYGWVCAPNASAQSISANTITKLNVDTIVSDEAGLLTMPSANVFTIPEGNWYVEAWASLSSTSNVLSAILSLYDEDASAFVTRASSASYQIYFEQPKIETQIKLPADTLFSLRVLSYVAADVRSAAYLNTFSNSTSGADQRTSIKLWKLD